MIVNNWYVFFDFQNWRDCSSEHDWDGGKVLIAGEFCRINTALLMSRSLKTDGDGAFVHTLALSPCLPHMRFAGDSPY